MKILYIGPSVYDLKGVLIPDSRLLELGIKRSNFFNSSCFGYDVVVINPKSLSVLLNRSDVINGIEYSHAFHFNSKIAQWRKELADWISRGGNLYVILQPYVTAWGKAFDDSFVSISNYNFLPINTPGTINESSGERYIGEVVTSNPLLRDFLGKDQFLTAAYIEKNVDAKIDVNSILTDNRVTSFDVDYGTGKMHFLPEPISSVIIFKYITNLYSSVVLWKTVEQRKIESEIEKIDVKIDELNKSKSDLVKKLDLLVADVQSIAEADIFYTKASKKLRSIKLSKLPDPREIYDILETIENAFVSENEMRKNLDISKTECGVLTRRCNESRHDQKGVEPKALTEKELKDFLNFLDVILEKYLQYLYNKFVKKTN